MTGKGFLGNFAKKVKQKGTGMITRRHVILLCGFIRYVTPSV